MIDFNDKAAREEHARRFFATLDAFCRDAESNPVGKALRAHSAAWAIEHTGGGCITWSLQLGDTTVWITDESGSDVPKALDEPVCVGFYAADDDCGEGFLTRYEPNLAAALSIVDRPTIWEALMCQEYTDWLADEAQANLDERHGSADEVVLDENATDVQRAYLQRFCERWDQMIVRVDAWRREQRTTGV